MTMSINASSLLRLVAIVTAALDSANAVGNVTYNVYVGGSGSCPPSDIFVSTLMEPQEQEIGFCQNHGMGANLYSSIQVLGCSDKCLCFKQIAAESADVNCDESKAFVTVVKMACFDQCLSDCNGPDCGKTAQPMDPPNTRLMPTGSGPICVDPVAEEDFVCEFNGMKLIDGNVIGQFNANAEEDKDEDVDDVGKTDGAGNMTANAEEDKDEDVDDVGKTGGAGAEHSEYIDYVDKVVIIMSVYALATLVVWLIDQQLLTIDR